MSREYEAYLRQLKSQVTHDIPEGKGIWDKSTPPPLKVSPPVEKPLPNLGNQIANNLVKEKLESLANERASALAKCELLQEQLNALAVKYEAQIRETEAWKSKSVQPGSQAVTPSASPALSAADQQLLEDQGRELQHEVIRRQQETEAFKLQLAAQTRQIDLLRMARDSGHATVLDLQRKLEDQEHQLAQKEHDLNEETTRREGLEAELKALRNAPRT